MQFIVSCLIIDRNFVKQRRKSMTKDKQVEGDKIEVSKMTHTFKK